MAFKVLALTLCLLLCTSCSPITMSTEDLLVPPRLNQRQTKVEAALDATMNLSSILYRYPRTGEHRSPFVFYDLDGDGAQEAIVFYTDRATQMNVRIGILQEGEDDSWTVVQDIAGSGDQVEFIRFANISSAETLSVLIGWQDSRSNQSTLSVYALQRGKLETSVQMPYDMLDVDEYFGDGLSQILLVRRDNSNLYQLYLLGGTYDGQVGVLGDLSLHQDLDSVLQMKKGRLWGNRYALYIDERRTDALTATEIVAVSRDRLELLVGGIDPELYNRTARPEEALCLDLRGDGVVEIPTQTELPGDQSGEIGPPPLTLYLHYVTGGDFEVAFAAAVNADAGYLVFFPSSWLDQVTIQRSPESNEWHFYKIDPETDQPVVELLRIRVQSSRDYLDRFVRENYILLAERELFQYYAYLPSNPGEPLAITQAELTANLFMLL